MGCQDLPIRDKHTTTFWKHVESMSVNQVGPEGVQVGVAGVEGHGVLAKVLQELVSSVDKKDTGLRIVKAKGRCSVKCKCQFSLSTAFWYLIVFVYVYASAISANKTLIHFINTT